MKYRHLLFLSVLLISKIAFAQPGQPFAKKTSISNILTITLPDGFLYNRLEEMHLDTWSAQVTSGAYEVDYFDTVVAPIETEIDFQTALKGFLIGKFSGPQFEHYDFTVADTSIGNSNGLWLTGFTKETLVPYQHFFCYLTIANDKSYWFFAFQPVAPTLNTEATRFFNSIEFSREKIKERTYLSGPVSVHKKAGEIWSPEQFQKRNVMDREGMPVKPPPPPSP